MTTKKRTEPAANGGTKNDNPAQSMNKPHASQRRYTEQQKIAGVIAMRTYGGVGTDAALEAVRKVVGDNVASATLYQWAIEYADKVDAIAPPERLSDSALVQGVRDQVVGDMQSFLQKAAHLITQDDKLKAEPVKSLVLSMAITIDKLKMLADISPQEEQAYRSFRHRCQVKQIDPITALNDYADEL